MSDEQDERAFVVRGEERIAMALFVDRIAEFNKMYKLGKITDRTDRLLAFESILSEECKEITELHTLAGTQQLVALADLLGDIVVYCASEAERWNIPLGEVLTIIMDSNGSKLNEDGTASYDERGKLLKGPNYWKPEPKIKELLVSKGVV